MSKAFVKETDDEADLPDERPAIPAGVKNYMTPEGHRRMQDELRQLLRVERPKVVETVAWAAGNGDRSENGDYIYGKKRLREVDRRIRFLIKRLDNAEVVDPAARLGAEDEDRVYFGATIDVAGSVAVTVDHDLRSGDAVASRRRERHALVAVAVARGRRDAVGGEVREDELSRRRRGRRCAGPHKRSGRRAGADCPQQASVDKVAEATVRCLLHAVPAAVPGIVFLSGGQPPPTHVRIESGDRQLTRSANLALQEADLEDVFLRIMGRAA